MLVWVVGHASPLHVRKPISMTVVSAAHPSKDGVRHLLVRRRGQFHCIPATKIVWCEAAGNYVQLCLGSSTLPVRSTLTAIAARLTQLRFERISRTTIVNLDWILTVQPTGTGEFDVTLQGGWSRRLTRRYRPTFLKRFLVV
jgi:two-component system, LytTR family, response regulator